MSANMGTFVLMSLLVLAVSPAAEGQSAMSAAVATNTLKAALPTPNKAVDIIFALDRSGSVGRSNYNKIIDFVKAVLSHFSVEPTTTRVAVVSFGTDAKVEFDLLRSTSNNNNKCELLRTYIPTIKYTGGATNTIGALNLASELLQKSGVRPDATKVIFTITDGNWNVGGDPLEVVTKLQGKDVYMYAFGIGAWGVNNYRLSGLGNKDSQGHKYVYLFLDFDVLKEVARRFKGDLQNNDYLPSTRCSYQCNQATRSCQCNVYTGNYGCVCKLGYTCNTRHDTECYINTYKDTLGPGQCKNCPANSGTSGRGATNKDDCKCTSGYYQVGAPIERCERVTCHEPAYDTNAVKAVSCGTWAYNDRCTLECKSGYAYASGNRQLTCQSDGEWDGNPLSCERVTCPTLTAPPDGSIGACGNRYGDTCTFQCGYSFKLSGSPTTTCTAAEKWSHPTPTCNKLLCRNSEIADPFPNAARVCSGLYTEVDQVCSVTCDRGHTPTWAQYSQCLAVNGTAVWQNLPRACEVDKCTPLTDPSDGTVSPVLCKTSPEYNTQCTYSCNKQYTLHGPTSKTCSPGGEWSSTAVTSCRDEMDPTFSNCSGDITTVAPSQKTGANVFWLVPVVTDNSGSTPTVDVDITTSLGTVNFLQRTPPIWFPEGQYTVTYTATDQEGNRATCDFSIHVQVTRCSQLGTPANGESDPNPCGVLRGSRCTFSCKYGYNLVGTADSTCRDDGSWTRPAPTCDVVHCSSLSAPPNTTMSGCVGTNSKPYGTRCYFDCNLGYKIKKTGQGTRSRQCLADGSWSGDELECEVETCSGLPIPPNGAISPSTCTSESNYSTVCRLSCNVGYQTSGPTEQTCNADGQWSNQGKLTTCIDTQPPTFSSCPSDQTVYTGSGETSAITTWTVPTATDNSGDTPTVTRVEGNGPGSTFAKGTHSIKYTAVDSTGRNNDCSFRITVKAVYCTTLNAPSSGRATCDQNDRRYGTTCQFQCNLGYRLVGNHTSSCEKDSRNVGFWTTSAPSCEIVTCPSLSTPVHGTKSGCKEAHDENYNTVCTFYCNNGYSSLKASIQRTCQQNGTWSGSALTCTIDTCTALSPIQNGDINPSVCTSNPEYNDECTYSCEVGYTLAGSQINKCLDGGRWQNSNSVSCRDVTKPAFHGCPSDIYVTADGGEGSVNITWTPPNATDSTGIVPTVTSTGVKTTFGEGSHHVTYTAEDAAGNRAKCQFAVVVTVHRCKSLPPPAFGQFVSTCSNLRGSSCSMECHTGYRLTGPATRACVVTNNGTTRYWDGVETKCEIFRCSPLSKPSHGTIIPTSCTVKKPVAGTQCTYHCLPGFELQNDINATECNATGHWSPSVSSTPTCRDIRPPDIRCPKDRSQNTAEGAGTAIVNWDNPIATDNTAVTITVSPNGTEPPSVFSIGTHIINYTATDSAGQTATCEFRVTIRDIEKPNITCPSDIEEQTDSRSVSVSWAVPVATDNSGVAPTVTSDKNPGDKFQLGREKVTYEAIDGSGNRATCTFRVLVKSTECVALDTPANGALVCGFWLFLAFCLPECDENSDFRRGYVPSRYVCYDGTWITDFDPHAPSANLQIEDCVASKTPNVTKKGDVYFYYSGNCSDPNVQQQIKEAFIKELDEFACMATRKRDPTSCSIDNVFVTCGTRSKRSLWHSLSRMLRQTSDDEVGIAFTITVVPENLNATVNEAASVSVESALATMDSVFEGLKNATDSGELQLEVDGETLGAVPDSLQESEVVLQCPTGMAWNNDTQKCVGCPAGFYFNEGNNTCVDCPLGSYQDQHNQLSCEPCPDGTWTEDIGSRNDTYCNELCQAGWHSSTGLQPCTECSLGTYQPDTGSTSCISCPSTQTTNATAATSAAFCFDRCQAGHFSPNGLAPCTPCEQGEYQSAQQSTSCLQCPLGYTTASGASDSSADCFNIDECAASPCVNNGTCSDRINAYLCRCLDGYSGDNCDIDTDECSSSPCVNGICTDEIDGYTCVCTPGFTGEDCSTDIDDCEANPCSNGAECIDGVDSFNCDCLRGYTGIQCEVDVNECASTPCANNASCNDLVDSFVCVCTPGFTGTRCEQNIDDCDVLPCKNGGTCVDGVNSYICLCNDGFTGDDCEVNVDDCASTPCANNGTCVDMVAGYSCECVSGYAGANCTEDFDECSSSPCQNGGTCEDLFDTYTCTCNQGYTGVNCEAEIDHCATSPCSNGATCIDKHLDFECQCSPGYEGPSCETEINECAPNPCLNNGTCYDQVDGYICLCTDEYTGTSCESMFSPCESTPCHNGATCTDNYPDYECVCPTGYGGSTCSINLPECASGPCNNGGTCVDGMGNFSCSCPSGFEGDLCESQIDECERSGCENGGRCTDIYGGFNCDCPVGYNGTRCEVNIDDCATHGCTNGSECVDGIASYTCDCLSGYTGPTCSEDVDECSSNPCLNTLNCNNLVDDYMCECQDGFAGKNCEINIDDCENVTCHNGGECVDRVAGFNCNCPDGFSGGVCEIDVDECASGPCQSSGTCMDGIYSYSCQCQTGYTGTNCELDIDECINSPCQNAARCTNTHGDYSCACLSGYEGKDCDVNTDDCQGHACQNNGTCVDQLNNYTCLCAAGFTGDRCESDVDDCDFNSCKNGGTCVDSINSVTCQCAPGYHGDFCETETDDCATLPCQNDGSCTDIGSDYRCDCVMGFNGKDCEMNIDDCVGHMCRNEAVCEDGVGNYTCTCKPSFIGTYCETELSSDFDLVFDGSVDGYSSASYNIPDMTAVTVSFWMQTTDRSNYGTAFSYALSEEVGSDNALTIYDYNAFTVYVNGETAYSTHGIQDDNWHHIAVIWTNTGQWTLFDDGHPVDSGSGLGVSSSISGGGLAIVGQEQDYIGGGFTPDEAFIGSLHGLNWWSRELSDSEITDLATNCNHSLRGDVLTWADFLLNVEGDINVTAQSVCDDTKECLSSPCENNATCTDYLGGYRCTCLPGFTGVHCEVNIDECLGTTCDNGGTCVDLVNDFLCSCPAAYHGKNCELDVTTCSPNPCEHGGNCTDSGGGTYSCSCSPGYSGNDCEVDVDECSSGPCTNGGTCVDMVNDYYCDCPNGFFGQNCDGEVDYCDPNLCQHGGTCQPITNDYNCTCPAGYTGYNCEINIDECEGVECLNNGTCVDGIASYTCACVDGFTGTHCGTNIDDCQGNLCENGGTCVDGVASYTCDCPTMFTGDRCHLVILPNLPQTTEPYLSTGQTPTPSSESSTSDTGRVPPQDGDGDHQTLVIIVVSISSGGVAVVAVVVLSWKFCRSPTPGSKITGLRYMRPPTPKVGVMDNSMILSELPTMSRSTERIRENPYVVVEG